MNKQSSGCFLKLHCPTWKPDSKESLITTQAMLKWHHMFEIYADKYIFFIYRYLRHHLQNIFHPSYDEFKCFFSIWLLAIIQIFSLGIFHHHQDQFKCFFSILLFLMLLAIIQYFSVHIFLLQSFSFGFSHPHRDQFKCFFSIWLLAII